MKTRTALILALRLVVLAIAIWLIATLVDFGLPLQWVAIFVGGSLAIGSVLTFLIEPLMRKAIPDLDARQRAIVGFVLPRRVVVAIRIAYIVLGSAAAAWGLTAPL
jgi:hypothetical protein